MGLFVRRQVPAPVTYPASLRPMDSDDLPVVAGIEAQSFDDAWSVAELSNLLIQDHKGWVLHVRGRVEGYGLGVAAGSVFFCDRLAVDCHQRGNGYGASLVEYAKLLAVRLCGCERILLPVALQDWQVCEFFSSQGFVGTEVHQDEEQCDWVTFCWRRGWE